jgi:hypothetical protein
MRRSAGSRGDGLARLRGFGAVEDVRSGRLEVDDGKVGWAERTPLGVGHDERDRGVAQGELDGGPGELDVQGDGDEPGSHDAEEGGQVLDAVDVQDGHAVPAFEAAPSEPPHPTRSVAVAPDEGCAACEVDDGLIETAVRSTRSPVVPARVMGRRQSR